MQKLDNTIPNIQQKDYSLGMPIIDAGRGYRDYARFDVDNLFPQRILEIADSSPMQSAILNNRIGYILGAGLSPTVENINTPNLQESWYSLLQKCTRDFVYLGAYAIQLCLSESGNKFYFWHVPVDQVRLGKYTDKNIIEKAYICSDWRKTTRDRIIEIKMWGSETPTKGERYLMYVKPYKAGEYYYAIPYWYSAVNYCLADVALAEYYNNYIRNNFSANLSIAFPTEPTEEKKEELYNNLMESFGGSKSAGNILCLFGENGSLPTISAIESANADLYNSVVDTIKLALVSANRLTSPILAGISTSSGFSSKSDEIIAAAVQYRLSVINGERQFILDKFNDLLQMNGNSRCLSIDDYNLAKEFEGTSVEENNDKLNDAIGVKDTEGQESEDASAENNVENKEE